MEDKIENVAQKVTCRKKWSQKGGAKKWGKKVSKKGDAKLWYTPKKSNWEGGKQKCGKQKSDTQIRRPTKRWHAKKGDKQNNDKFYFLTDVIFWC